MASAIWRSVHLPISLYLWALMMRLAVASQAAGEPLDVVVVGGGPVGLTAAIVAAKSGHRVRVHEKRNGSYTRNTHFDLVGTAVDLYGSWGFFQQIQEYDMDRDSGVVTVRCCELEKFLYSVSRLCGVQIAYNVEIASLDQLRDHVDVVVVADGLRSPLRSSLNVTFEQANARVYQHTLIVRFRQCPKARQVPPEHAAFVLPGVSFVYKRFFGGHCHLQVLLTNNVEGRRVLDDPWNFLLRVTDQVLEFPAFADVQALKDAVESGQYQHVVIRVRLASEGTILLKNNVVVSLMGDAFLSASYRLGVGLNNAVNSMADFQAMLCMLAGAPPGADKRQIVKEKNDRDLLRGSAVAHFQNMMVDLEANKGYFTFFDSLSMPDDEDDEFFDDEEQNDSECQWPDITSSIFKPSFSVYRMKNKKLIPKL